MRQAPGTRRGPVPDASFAICCALLALVSVLLGGCGAPGGGPSGPAGPIRFTEVSARAGVAFQHLNGGYGRHLLPETLGPGGAVFDYDGDGNQDLLLLQGRPLNSPNAANAPTLALFRNEANGRFTDVTRGSGLDVPLYGIGAAVGDYDNDGRPDLYVTALGGNRLFHNLGGGRFIDVSSRAGIGGRDLCTGAAWLDADQDGRLDLFVCRYTDWSAAREPECRDQLGRSAYCAPRLYPEARNLLYRNVGGGRFRDVSGASGIASATGRCFSAALADYNDDGRADLFVSSDLTPGLLFLSRGVGKFSEAGVASGVAFPETGNALAGMGVDTGDYDNDGRPDLVVTGFEAEPVMLFRNLGAGGFMDESYRAGLGEPCLPYLKWGCRLADLDLDGFADLFVASGHLYEEGDDRSRKTGRAQACRVLRNERGGGFADVSGTAGAFFAQRQVARGAGFGDLDQDGDPDVVLGCNNGSALLLRNDSPHGRNWVGLTLEGAARGERPATGCNRDAVGARVRVTIGTLRQTQFVRSGGSYLFDHDRRLAFGLGGAAGPARVEIRWPCGAVQELEASPGRWLPVLEQQCRRQ